MTADLPPTPSHAGATPSPGSSGSGAQVALTVSDKALATLIAHTAAHTPGVARLQPSARQAAQAKMTTAIVRASSILARRQSTHPGDTTNPTNASADPAAVQITHEDASTTATVRIIAATHPPVLRTVQDLHHRIGLELHRIAATHAVLIVHVIDIDASAEPGPNTP